VSIPRINIVQKVGELSTLFPGGTILLSKQTILYEPPVYNAEGRIQKPGLPGLVFVVAGFGPTRYTEKMSGGALGRMFESPEAVAAAGGTINYNEWEASGKKRVYAEQTEEALILIRRPEHLKENVAEFPFIASGHAYAVARWSLKGTAFTHGAKPIMTQRKFGVLSNRSGRTYADGLWTLTTVLKNMKGNFYYQPVVQLQNGFTDPELRELALALRG
jgi:hypothetical protein